MPVVDENGNIGWRYWETGKPNSISETYAGISRMMHCTYCNQDVELRFSDPHHCPKMDDLDELGRR